MSNKNSRRNHHFIYRMTRVIVIPSFFLILFLSVLNSKAYSQEASKADSTVRGKYIPVHSPSGKTEWKYSNENIVFDEGDLFSKVLRIRGSAYFILHMRDQQTTISYGYYSSSSTTENPSVAAFFDDGGGFGGNLLYSFNISSTSNLHLVFGFGYDAHSLDGSNASTYIILGKELSIKALSFPIGIEFPMMSNSDGVNIWGSGSIAPTVKYYEGKYSAGGYDYTHNYDANFAIRFNGDMIVYNIFNSRLFLNITMGLEIASVDRKKVDVYQNGTKVGEGIPTGKVTLQDNNFMVGIGLGYTIKF